MFGTATKLLCVILYLTTLTINNVSGDPSNNNRNPHQEALLKNIEKLKDMKKALLEVPLFCWKLLVDCRRKRNHVCCPVMPDFLKHRDDIRTKRAIYSDPQFGIPLAHPPRQRCSTDCRRFPTDPCCHNAKRHWTTHEIETGLKPIEDLATSIAHDVFYWLVVFFGWAAWKFIYRMFTMVLVGQPRRVESIVVDDKPSNDDLVDLSSRVVLAVEGEDWLPRLNEQLKQRVKEAGLPTGAFLCCLTPASNSDNELEKRTKRQLSTMECYPRKRPERWWQRSQEKDNDDDELIGKLDCPSSLMYDFWVAGVDKDSKPLRKWW